jgi:hypothetical protein
LHLQFRFGKIAFGYPDFGFVLGASRIFFGFLLQHIVSQFAILRLFVQEVA